MEERRPEGEVGEMGDDIVELVNGGDEMATAVSCVCWNERRTMFGIFVRRKISVESDDGKRKEVGDATQWLIYLFLSFPLPSIEANPHPRSLGMNEKKPKASEAPETRYLSVFQTRKNKEKRAKLPRWGEDFMHDEV